MDDKQELLLPIFDSSKYLDIRPRLTPQARAYFDTITQEEGSPLFNIRVVRRGDTFHLRELPASDTPGSHERGIVRVRTSLSNLSSSNRGIVSPYAESLEKFSALETQIGSCKVSIRMQSIAARTLQTDSYDYIYISNAGYKRLPELLQNLFHDGAHRIGFTLAIKQVPVGGEGEIKEKLINLFIPKLHCGARLKRLLIDHSAHYGVYVELAKE